jgi:hypothetical protein
LYASAHVFAHAEIQKLDIQAYDYSVLAVSVFPPTIMVNPM